MTNEQLASKLIEQVQFNDALDETCLALMEAAAEKLRGEQQAVAWVSPEQLDALRRGHDSVSAAPHKWRTSHQTVPLYTLPQPAAVADDAVAALPAKWHERYELKGIRLDARVFREELEATLAQDRASQDS